MKEKNGFTLVELLAVIAIIGLLIGIAVPSTLLISNKIKEKQYESKVKNIEMALNHWAEDNLENCEEEIKSITVGDLVNKGYYKPDDSNTKEVKNPKDNTTLNNKKAKDLLDDIGLTSDEDDKNNITQICEYYKRTYSDSTPLEPTPSEPESGESDIVPDKNKYCIDYCSYPSKSTNLLANKIKENSQLKETKDTDGTTYYFQGNVTNNYVKFAGLIWRIVRINGDGSIRLILNEPILNYSYFNGEMTFSGTNNENGIWFIDMYNNNGVYFYDKDRDIYDNGNFVQQSSFYNCADIGGKIELKYDEVDESYSIIKFKSNILKVLEQKNIIRV